jgi:DNA-binding MarR family transcriptional regulator
VRFNLEAAKQLVPYIKLVERERLRIPTKSKAAYDQFFSSAEFERLFNDLIINKLAISQITALLREKPLSTGEMAQRLGLNPSELSRHINNSSRQGFVKYDEGQKCYTLA